MKLFLLVFGMFGLMGCATLVPGMPGTLSESESKVEGTTEISVSPGWLYNSMIKLGVYRNNKMEPNEAVLVVETKYAIVQSKDGLVIKIDGEKTSFTSIDQLSSYSNGFFNKRFMVKLDYIDKMVNGKSVWVRVNGNDNTYLEGEFSTDGKTTARPGFRKFIEKVNKK